MKTDESPASSHGELTVRQTEPVDTDIRLNAGRHSPADLWTAIATSDGFTRPLTEAVRSLLADVPHHDRVQTLLDAGATVGDGGYARQITRLDRSPESEAYQKACAVTAQFGQGEPTLFGHRLEFCDLRDGPLPLLNAADVTPTITVRLNQGFRERRREQREHTCRLLTILATSCRVVIVTTGRLIRWLSADHGDELPATFSEHCTTGENTPHVDSEQVDAALDQFDADSRAVTILRELAAEPSQTLSYHELTSLCQVSSSRVSQVLGSLEDADLIDRYGSQEHRQVDLSPTGLAFLEELDEELGRQQHLDELISDARQRRQRTCESAPHERDPTAPQDADTAEAADTATAPYRTRFLDRRSHLTASAAATAGDITAVQGPFPPLSDADRRTRSVSYDEDRDEALISVNASTPLQWAVSLAVGLASPRLLGKALPDRRLEILDEPPTILRDARCCGALSNDAIDDPAILRENLIEWGKDIEEMTRKLRHEEYEDRDRFCGEILRASHGLAGTIVHLLDAAGVDLIRELRVPSLTDEQLSPLARTIAVSTGIQSKYGVFASWRQLYEQRDHKRQAALTPEVDASDPRGEMIGSLVIRGPRADRLGYHVEGMLSSPASVHEDAPEFAISVTIATPGREAYTAAVNRMLGTKNIRATPEAVTMFQALAGNVWTVTEAIHWLQGEDNPRTIRLDEVRVALATLEPDRLLSDAPPSVSRILAALLQSSRPLTRQELAERADVSMRSISRHLDTLVALDIVRKTNEGELRLSLPFGSNDDGRDGQLPAPVDENLPAQKTVFELVLAMVDAGEAGRLGDPSDPLGKPFFGPTLELGPLQRHLPRVNPWVKVAKTLSGTSRSDQSTIQFGARLEQTGLGTAVEGTVV